MWIGIVFVLLSLTLSLPLLQQQNREPAIDEMSEHLGIPQRTLFYAFRKWLGIGPHAYFQLVRLHKLRDLLKTASPSDASVTSLATKVGFNHMGRLSAAYRELFGEVPRDTLRRR